MPAGELVVALRDVRKDYHGLRPLRIQRFELRQGESVALLGLDRAAAEVLVDLITAATLPDSGEVDVFGSSTRDIADPDTWLRALDRFGIVSERVVLLDELTAEQNLAFPLSLDIDDIPAELRAQVHRLAGEAGIPLEALSQSPAVLGLAVRLRLRLAKALALNPAVLLAEHPNAVVPPEEVPRLASDLSALAAERGVAMLVITADGTFARAVAERVLTLRPATGELAPAYGWRDWFTRSVR